MNKRPYITPDGYFDYLQMRLTEIPEQEQKPAKVRTWQKISPYVALAACFAVAILAGRFILERTAPASAQEDYITYEQLYYSDLLPYTSQYALFDEDFFTSDFHDEYYTEDTSDDDVLNYLLNSNIPLSYIEMSLGGY